jgi:hypothetical protein
VEEQKEMKKIIAGAAALLALTGLGVGINTVNWNGPTRIDTVNWSAIMPVQATVNWNGRDTVNWSAEIPVQATVNWNGRDTVNWS